MKKPEKFIKTPEAFQPIPMTATEMHLEHKAIGLGKYVMRIGFICFVLGALAQLALLYFVSRSIHQELWFTWTHHEEVRFAREKYNLIQEAGRRLYFEDHNMEGMTIIKPVKAEK